MNDTKKEAGREALIRLMRAAGMGEPYDWQREAHAALRNGAIPAAIQAPTGAGKTALMVCWLAVLAEQAMAGTVTLPRRYMVVINRRALVDSASDLAMRLADALEQPDLADIRLALSGLSSSGAPLNVSTLRGQRADACEWQLDPSMPAIIAATPDMAGSRLLFGGYGLGRSRRATHAGLLGLDTLIVHDESHLSPALSVLLRSVETMAASGAVRLGRPPLAVVEMTATPRGVPAGRTVITCHPLSSPALRRRMQACKRLRMATGGIAAIVKAATVAAKAGQAVAVYITSPEDAGKVADGVAKAGVARVATLTGTMRGHERDALVNTPAFRCFLPDERRESGGAVLVATAAGEIGIDIDADALLTDAATLDRMAQRAGRCNRRGLAAEALITVYTDASKPPKALEAHVAAALQLLDELPSLDGGGRDASPLALSVLLAHPGYADAIEPAPGTRPLSRDVVDLYALTSAGPMLKVPDRALYIRGIRRDEPEITLAWRALPRTGHADWLAAWPLSLRELARLPLYKADKLLQERLAAHPAGQPFALIVAPDGETLDLIEAGTFSRRLGSLRDGDLVILSLLAGGLSAGVPDPKAADAVTDVSGDHSDARGHERGAVGALQVRYTCTDLAGPAWTCEGARVFTTVEALLAAVFTGWQVAFHDAPEPVEDWAGEVRYWLEKPGSRSPDDGDDAALNRCDRLLSEHHALTGKAAARLVARLPMKAPFGEAVRAGGPVHDAGKAAECWQAAIGQGEGAAPLAKSASPWFDFRASAGYRHELGSVVEAEGWTPLQRHLVATHHGWARPGFSAAALAHDGCHAAGLQAVRDFAALHDALGPWALAYLEAVLKGADIQAERLADVLCLDPDPVVDPVAVLALPVPAVKSWCVAVNVRNPAEYFACLGVAALARALRPDAAFTLHWSPGQFTLSGLEASDVRAMLADLCAATVCVEGDPDDKWSALALVTAGGVRLPLHAWVDDSGLDGSKWKWSVGNTDGADITRRLLKAGAEWLALARFDTLPLFQQGSALVHSNPATAKYRLDAAGSWSAVGVGYSIDKEPVPKSSRPWVEILSVLGVQTFAPAPAGGRGWCHFTWAEPLPFVAALSACRGGHPSCDRQLALVTTKSGKNTDALLSTVTGVALPPVGVFIV
jgi:CRISPR-associated endonuclease/helicase Cas3